jgi:hypothetical protein
MSAQSDRGKLLEVFQNWENSHVKNSKDRRAILEEESAKFPAAAAFLSKSSTSLQEVELQQERVKTSRLLDKVDEVESAYARTERDRRAALQELSSEKVPLVKSSFCVSPLSASPVAHCNPHPPSRRRPPRTASRARSRT